jgi:Domain of Unknown Function (DUF1206)
VVDGARRLQSVGPRIVWLARVGFVAKGVVYIVIGVIAAGVALGMRRRFADAGGALRILVTSPSAFGVVQILSARYRRRFQMG